ncbi:unnamed protein product [Rhodiola kirilowii]
MDIDLRLPTGETDREEDEDANGFETILDGEIKLSNGDGELDNLTIVGCSDNVRYEHEGDMNSQEHDLVDFKEDSNLEPISGMEFESHGEAYSFYQEYARSNGFNTAIQNSRRSKTSREFIDAKFACSRYGTKREYDKSFNRPRARQAKQEPNNSAGRRSCAKTDCKASMHVKRRPDGKWVIHRFIKEHNHELQPAQAVSEQTRKMYAAMARQFAEYKNLSGLKTDSKTSFDKSRGLALDAGDLRCLLEYFTQMQTQNSNFFYTIDLGDDQHLRNLLWVDAKSRHDYMYFNDVVSFDTTYVRSKYRLPLALFVGVNQHYQFVLLGCALLFDESPACFTWLMQMWLRAMGGQAPKVIITDQEVTLKSVISQVFPNAAHCFCLWNVMGRVSENLGHNIKSHENFMPKFEKCIYKSWTMDEFDRRWGKLVERFELKEDSFFQSLYEDQKHWVPLYMRDVVFVGMCTQQRSDSVNSFFDKYLHKKTTVRDFIKQYEAYSLDRYEEETRADSDPWNKQPITKSPSPLEKHMSMAYTHAVFKKSQVELLGAIACHPKLEVRDGHDLKFRVQDVEKTQEFTVVWNEYKADVSCICRLFEYKGFLCRHAMIVLQICGQSQIPSQYILKRWAKDAKMRQIMSEEPGQVPSRMQRYDDLCQRAMRLGEEAALSQESYEIAFRAIDEALSNCAAVNNSSKSTVEAGISASHGLCIEGENQGLHKTSRIKNSTKKRKVTPEQDDMTAEVQNLQQMDKMGARGVSLDGIYGTQHNVQGMVQLNLMAPTRDNFYSNPQGLGQLHSIAPAHDGYYAPAPSMHNLSGQMDFFRTPAAFTYGLRDESNIRPTRIHGDHTRHA